MPFYGPGTVLETLGATLSIECSPACQCTPTKMGVKRQPTEQPDPHR